MSFRVTVYFNNEYIDSTEITTPDGNTYTGYFEDAAYTAEAPMYNFITIKANPAKGCVFSHWVYRYVVNGEQSDPLYDFGERFNPRSYDGSEGDLIIRAVGEKQQTVKKWSWEASNGTATKEQTEKAYDAVMYNGPTKNFSFKVWNDMVNKVKAILDEDDGEWDTNKGEYLTYEKTKMTEKDRTLTAARFNSLRYNAGYMSGEVDPGDTVRGSYFTALTNTINNWIDSL